MSEEISVLIDLAEEARKVSADAGKSVSDSFIKVERIAASLSGVFASLLEDEKSV
jgi:hypothetical protein